MSIIFVKKISQTYDRKKTSKGVWAKLFSWWKGRGREKDEGKYELKLKVYWVFMVSVQTFYSIMFVIRGLYELMFFSLK